ncbi:uracil-DNA glycosylase [bacterium]|nr:uracil-DNA glycosylase [bacterium]|tara:strand:+ start:10183 stop:10854 length:672 start_codon:yes stop_codon:yes gene_type:complete
MNTDSIQLEQSWKQKLSSEFGREYFKALRSFVHNEYANKNVFPHPRDMFRAFNLCPFDDVKVVILGQDPYHGPGQANGLCFAVNEGTALPPSLQNIFKEIESDLGHSVEKNGDLERWARQGVLLLNATLTVRAREAGSHQGRGWEEFTNAVVRVLSEEREGVVFMLWGRYAKDKGKDIDWGKHLVLEAAHPSPFSAHSGFFGCKHFSRANEYLKNRGEEPIQW